MGRILAILFHLNPVLFLLDSISGLPVLFSVFPIRQVSVLLMLFHPSNKHGVDGLESKEKLPLTMKKTGGSRRVWTNFLLRSLPMRTKGVKRKRYKTHGEDRISIRSSMKRLFVLSPMVPMESQVGQMKTRTFTEITHYLTTPRICIMRQQIKKASRTVNSIRQRKTADLAKSPVRQKSPD